MKRIIVFFLAVIISGCASQTKPVSPPDWYINNAIKSSADWVGYGSGRSLADARNRALDDIASQLQVTVKSQMNTRLSKRNGVAKTKFYQQIQGEVGQITLTNYQVLNKTHLGDKYYIALKISKSGLINSLMLQSSRSKEKLTKDFSLDDKTAYLSKYLDFKKRKTEIARLMASLSVIYSHSGDERFNQDWRKLDDLVAQYESLVDDFRFSLSLKGAAKKLRKPLLETIKGQGLKVSSRGCGDGVVEITSREKKYQSFGSYNIAADVSIGLKSCAGKLLFAKEYKAGGASMDGYAAASRALKDEYVELFKNTDFFQQLKKG